MTDDPPDLDLLADLDAGLLDADTAATVRAAALADPRSAAVLTALAATRADLAALPAPPLPPDVAGRWAAALAAESVRRHPAAAGPTQPGPTQPGPTQPGPTRRTPATSGSSPTDTTPPSDTGTTPPTGTGPTAPGPTAPGPTAPGPTGPDPDRTEPSPTPKPRGSRASTRPSSRGPDRPRSARRPRPAVLAAGVLAAVVVTALLWARPDPLPSLDGVDLAAAGRSAVGATDAGGLADTARRVACLQSVAAPGVQPEAPLLGGRRVEIRGREAVLLVLASGVLGRFHVLVVDPGCGPDGGTLLGVEVVGR